MYYYTNFFKYKNKIYLRGIKNGKAFKERVKFNPYLFVGTKDTDTKYKTTDDKPVKRIDFNTMWEASEFAREYADVDGMEIYGLTNFPYLFIYEEFPDDITPDPSLISIVSLDIETKMGHEDIATAIETTPNEVTAITISRNGYKDVFGCGDYVPHEDKIVYHKCKDERELLLQFLRVWNSDDYCPDVITGWNIEFFDIPYLVGRILRILGEDYMKLLSPWGLVEPYEVSIKGRKVTSYELKGVTMLDYLAMYKKFRLKPRESYSLDYISEIELGEKKLNYNSQGYKNLDDLLVRNYQLYVEYNVKDVDLIDKLEMQLKYIELVFALAYNARINYSDALGSVLQWDIIIHKFLMDQNIVIPQQKQKVFKDFVGGYVKEVTPSMYKWVVSCDLNSLYPSLIQQYNISPENFIEHDIFQNLLENVNKECEKRGLI